MSTQPLAGLRIVDLTHVWAGPLATRILGDLGAEIVKIEAHTARGPAVVPPGSGLYPDGDPGEAPWNRQAVFHKLNRNKKSVALDLKSAEGRAAFLRLVGESDVVIENFSARAMASLGLGYDALRAANPGIIYIAMPGFGLSGPYRDFVAYGPSVEPMAGLTSLMGYRPGDPRVTAIALPDACAGVTAAAAVMTALWRRSRTGEGAAVDLSLHEATIAIFGEFVVEHELRGEEPEFWANGHPRYAPAGTYRCRGEDEWIAIAVRSDAEWRALAQISGQPWGDDPRFRTASARIADRAILDKLIASWTADEDKAALMEALAARGVPAGAVTRAPELLDDAALRARDFFVELASEHVGRYPYPGLPFLVDGRRGEGWRPAPGLGEDNREILGGLLGMTEDEIRALEEKGVLATRPPA